MGLYFNGEARDRCWGRGMFRGYVSGMLRGILSYLTRNFGGMLRGMFRGCATRVPFLNLGPPQKKTYIYIYVYIYDIYFMFHVLEYRTPGEAGGGGGVGP